MISAKQTVKGVTVGGSLKQTSSTPDTQQSVADSNIKGGLAQNIEKQQPSLQIGKSKALGKISVIALCVIIVVYFIALVFR